MPEFLVFQLYGPMASWGDIAVGEDRHSSSYPSKSAVTGLLAAALGIKREEDEVHIRFNTEYAIASCIRSTGEVIRDYHTVQIPKGGLGYATRRDELYFDESKRKTILSHRDYRTDAFYQVAIWCMNKDVPYTLRQIQQSLQKPKFNLYLGRKSCPMSLPLNPVILPGTSTKAENFTLRQAFDCYPLGLAERWTKRLNFSDSICYLWEKGGLTKEQLGLEEQMVNTRRDQVHTRRRWQFVNRDEYYFSDTLGDE